MALGKGEKKRPDKQDASMKEDKSGVDAVLTDSSLNGDAWEKEKTALKTDLLGARKAHDELHMTLTEKLGELQKLRETHLSVSEERDALNRELATLRGSFEQMRLGKMPEVESLRSKHEEALQKSREQFQTSLEAVHKVFGEKEATFQTQLSELRAVVDEVDTLRAQNAELTRMYDEATGQLSSVGARLQTFETDKMNALQALGAAHQQEKAELNDRMHLALKSVQEKFCAENKALVDAHEKHAQTLAGQLDAHRETLGTMETELDALKQHRSVLQEELTSHKSAIVGYKNKLQSAKQATAEIEQLGERAQMAFERVSTLEAETAKLQEALTQQAEAHQQERSRLEVKLLGENNARMQLQDRLQYEQQTAVRLGAKVDEVSLQMRRIQEDLAAKPKVVEVTEPAVPAAKSQSSLACWNGD